MNSNDARFLLAAVRADRPDESDSQIAEALRLAESDPELREWFAESTSFDQAVAERLREVPPPPDLRSSILAGMRASRPSFLRRRPLAWLASAAVLMLGLAGIWMLAPDPADGTVAETAQASTFAEFRAGMLREIEGIEALDHLSGDPEEIVVWLGENGIGNAASPAGEFGGEGLVGCKVLQWRGHRVSLVCFRRGGEETQPDLHLVTVPAEALRESDLASLGVFSGEPWSTAAWRDGEHVHLVVVQARHDDPQRLLPG